MANHSDKSTRSQSMRSILSNGTSSQRGFSGVPKPLNCSPRRSSLLSDLFVHDARQRRFVTAIASTFLNTSSKDFLVAEAAHIMTIFQFVLTHGVEFGLCALVDRLNDEVGDNISRINPRHHSQGSSGLFAGGFHQLTGRFSRLASCRFTHDFRQSFFQVLRDHRLNFVFNLTGHAIGEFREQLILKA